MLDFKCGGEVCAEDTQYTSDIQKIYTNLRARPDALDLAIGVGSKNCPISPEGFRWRFDIFAYCCNVESQSKSAKPKRSTKARIFKMWAAECLS